MQKLRKILFVLMGLSLIFPLIYFYRQLFPERIIPAGYEKYNITPAEYAIAMVGKDIVKQSQGKKLRGYIVSLKNIVGPIDEEIEKLKKDINLALGQYNGWMVIAPEEQLNEIKKRKNEDIARKKSLISAGFIDPEAYIRFQIQGDRIRVDYDIMAEWKWLPGSIENCQIIVTVINRSSGKAEFSSDVSFTHPVYFKKYRNIQQAILYGTYISSGIFGSAFLFFIITSSVLVLKRRKLEKLVPEAMQKLEEYIQKGSYTGANSLVSQQLDFFPANTDFIAFKHRLMVVTKDNPRRAEESYVRYINLGTKLRQNVCLTDEEYDDLKNLPQYLELPEITEMIAKYQKFIEGHNICKKIRQKQEQIRMFIDNGELSKAQEEMDSLYKDDSWVEYKSLVSMPEMATQRLALPSPDNFDNIREEVENRFKASKENVNRAEEHISKGEISEAEELLKEVVKTNKDLRESAENILSNIEKSRKSEKLCLKPEKIGKEIVVFKKDTITLARKARGTPDIDINNLKVSRDNHLKLCIVENKVIAEDLNSAGGTYHRGEKITRSQMEDGDILDISHSYRMTVHICRGREIVQSTLVPGTIPSEMKIDPRDIDEHQKISGLFIEADDRNIIVLAGNEPAIPIAFKSIGIVYEKSGDCQISVKDGVIVLRTPDTSQILCDGSNVDYKGIRYRIV
ncbi:MAG: FHA domain-containing protein [Elusimicrobia bacterium]|nr:FHA domain-containing protein [Elusimicrobiota bacterium]